MLNVDTKYILNTLSQMFPDATCELNFGNIYELAIAVILSAQTTDERVNLVTPLLFSKYPDVYSLSKADVSDVEEIIHSVGLSTTKSKNIIKFAEKVISDFSGVIPNTLEELITLPGVGRKTANVILFVGFNLPGLAVDTHVLRVSNRLGLVRTDNPTDCQKALEEIFKNYDLIEIHHLLLLFGRYFCTAKNPKCDGCLLKNYCKR